MGRAMFTSGREEKAGIPRSVSTKRPAYLNTPKAARFSTMPTTNTALRRLWVGCLSISTPAKKFTRMEAIIMST
mgnify:CR=1 FL=1